VGIETRNGHEYYYRKVRRGDRVCSRHIASGPFARYALLYDIVKRIEADEARDKEDAMLVADQAAERKHIEAFNQVDDVLGGPLDRGRVPSPRPRRMADTEPPCNSRKAGGI
jgi:hypothetical protein